MQKSLIANPKGLVDSNILIYAHDRKSKLHKRAKKWLEKTVSKDQLFISWQNLLEFYSIITSPKRATSPLSHSHAKTIINDYLKSFNIIYPNPTSGKIFIKILKKIKIVGPAIYDLYLASTALGNGLKTIYTTNTKDFEKIPGIKTINPL